MEIYYWLHPPRSLNLWISAEKILSINSNILYEICFVYTFSGYTHQFTQCHIPQWPLSSATHTLSPLCDHASYSHTSSWVGRWKMSSFQSTFTSSWIGAKIIRLCLNCLTLLMRFFHLWLWTTVNILREVQEKGTMGIRLDGIVIAHHSVGGMYL